jgi:hypothetical protein
MVRAREHACVILHSGSVPTIPLRTGVPGVHLILAVVEVSKKGLCHEADQSSLPIGLGLLMDPHVHCVGSRLGRLDWSAS